MWIAVMISVFLGVEVLSYLSGEKVKTDNSKKAQSGRVRH